MLFINPYIFPTKIGTEMCSNELFMWPNFQFDQSMCLQYVAEIANVQNENKEEK